MPKNEVILLLNSVFEQRKVKNPKYSLRAFARSLGLHSAALSTLMSGKRKVTPRLAIRILDKLKVSEPTIRLKMIEQTLGPIEPPPPLPPYADIDPKRFAAVRSWEHGAILAAIELSPAIDVPSLARKLGLSTKQTLQAIERLMHVGLLGRDDHGWKSTAPFPATNAATPAIDLTEFYRQDLEKVMNSLRESSAEDRQLSGITLTFDPENAELVKAAIRDFRRRLFEIAREGKPTRVYRLNVQFFPLSAESFESEPI